jgi:hypothetical protein
MSRSHRSPDIIRITCTDTFHRDSAEWARYGHHWLLNLRLLEAKDRVRLTVPGSQQRTRTVQVTTPGGSLVLFEHKVDPQSPVKGYRLAGDDRYLIFRFRCGCGRDSQRPENDLLEIAARYRGAFPDRRTEIDIMRLDQRDHV